MSTRTVDDMSDLAVSRTRDYDADLHSSILAERRLLRSELLALVVIFIVLVVRELWCV